MQYDGPIDHVYLKLIKYLMSRYRLLIQSDFIWHFKLLLLSTEYVRCTYFSEFKLGIVFNRCKYKYVHCMKHCIIRELIHENCVVVLSYFPRLTSEIVIFLLAKELVH